MPALSATSHCGCRGDLVKRVLVIGPCGAGKSTASHALASRLSLPLYHLDQMHWRAGWIEGSKEELVADLEPVLAGDRWIIDGNYGSTMSTRLERADTVFYLDFPIWLCLWRAIKRVWKWRGQTRPDMASGCPERFDREFFLYIASWNWAVRPRTERLLAATEARVIRFKQPSELAAFLEKLEPGNSGMTLN